MNNDSIKMIAGYTFGALVGAGIGFGIATLILDTINEAEEEELFPEEDDEEEEEIVTAPAKEKTKKERTAYNSMYVRSSGNQNPDLATLASSLTTEEAEENGNELLMMEEPEPEYVDPDEPRLISKKEFEDTLEFPEYTKRDLHYFPEDDVLSDAHDESIITQDPEKFLGDEALTAFGLDEENPDFVYIRNGMIETDYSIQQMSGSYSESVLRFKAARKVRRTPRNVVNE